MNIDYLTNETVGKWLIRIGEDGKGINPVRIVSVATDNQVLDSENPDLAQLRGDLQISSKKPDNQPFVGLTSVDTVIDGIKKDKDIAEYMQIDAPNGLFVYGINQNADNRYAKNACKVAQDLIGRWIIRTYENGGNSFMSGRIIGAESFEGFPDGKETKARKGMKYAPGSLFVMKFMYGARLLNIGTEAANVPSCVMITEANVGNEYLDGPGKVSKALNIIKDNSDALDGLALGGEVSIIGDSVPREGLTTLDPSNPKNAVTKLTYMPGRKEDPYQSNFDIVTLPDNGVRSGGKLSIIGPYTSKEKIQKHKGDKFTVFGTS
tara:strand:- start:6222 stop:7184 length:963 start_codon:yes stop_codon:yes gene_type:complete